MPILTKSPGALHILKKRNAESYTQIGNDEWSTGLLTGMMRMVLIAWAVASAFVMAKEGVLCLLQIDGVVSNSFNIRQGILWLYYLFFAIVVVVSELQLFKRSLKYFKVLQHHLGRAVFYIFLGSMCFGEEEVHKIIALNWCLLSIGNIVVHCYVPNNRSMKERKVKQTQTESPKRNEIDIEGMKRDEQEVDIESRERYHVHFTEELQETKGIDTTKFKLAFSNAKGWSIRVADPAIDSETSKKKEKCALLNAYDNCLSGY